MLKIDSNPRRDDRYPSERMEESRSVSLWSIWTLYAAEEALQWPVGELAQEMAARPEYAHRIIQVYKMAILDQKFDEHRRRIADEILGHIRAALVHSRIEVTADMLAEPIDYDAVPNHCGIEAWELNDLRPHAGPAA